MFPDRRCRTYFTSYLCVFCTRRATWELNGWIYCTRCRDIAFDYLNEFMNSGTEEGQVSPGVPVDFPKK